MADRWIYWHAGVINRPTSSEQLKQLAAAGDLLPEDLIWQEGGDPRLAVEAQSVLNFAALRESSGKWLDKVAEAIATAAGAAGAAPDWLADIQPTPSGEPAAGAQTPAPPASPPVSKVPAVTATSKGTVVIARPTNPASAPTPMAMPVSGVGSALVANPISPVSESAAPQAAPYPPRLIMGGASSRGRVRDRNEDRFRTQHLNWNDAKGMHEVAIIVVADGMGGYEGGDQASTLIVRAISEKLSAVPMEPSAQDQPPRIADTIAQAIQDANLAVLQAARSNARWKDMGATAAVAVIWNGLALFAHVGDCRVYIHHGSTLKQLTEDQTLVARMVALRQLTAEEAAQHESRNEVTQAIGKRPTIEPSRGEQKLARGDYLMVCCDGVAAHIENSAIQQLLIRSTCAPQHLASHLVQMADEAGGTDNCTVVVAQFA